MLKLDDFSYICQDQGALKTKVVLVFYHIHHPALTTGYVYDFNLTVHSLAKASFKWYPWICSLFHYVYK